MTAIAAARAEVRGLHNVSTRVLDLERIEEPDESYDVVLCREGLMFALEPARAACEICRVLRSGGRFAIAVWGPRPRNPWLAIVLDALSAELGAPVPPPGVPGPFSLENPTELAALLVEAGLTDVTVGELSLPTRAGSFEEWWARTCALAGPVANIVASLPEEGVQALRARARHAASTYEVAEGFAFPGLTLLAAGRRTPA